MLRCTIIGCVLGGYVGMAIKAMARRGKTPLVERVMDGISLWSVSACWPSCTSSDRVVQCRWVKCAERRGR